MWRICVLVSAVLCTPFVQLSVELVVIYPVVFAIYVFT
jgi:hypothetical protein